VGTGDSPVRVETHFSPSRLGVTEVTFTQSQANFNIHLVVWQTWGRAAEASWTEKSRTLFLSAPWRSGFAPVVPDP
jgi:hypothetical protein